MMEIKIPLNSNEDSDAIEKYSIAINNKQSINYGGRECVVSQLSFQSGFAFMENGDIKIIPMDGNTACIVTLVPVVGAKIDWQEIE